MYYKLLGHHLFNKVFEFDFLKSVIDIKKIVPKSIFKKTYSQDLYIRSRIFCGSWSPLVLDVAHFLYV